METGHVIVFVGLLVFLAHLFVTLFERTKIPDVLYLALVGVILGPILNIVTPDDFGKVGPIFTTIALVVILFEGGLDLNIEDLRHSLKGTTFITIASYGVSLVLLTTALRFLTPLPFQTSLFVGAVLAGPAPSIVIPLVRQLRFKESSKTILTLESSFGEALCIVVSLAVLESFKVDQIQIGHLMGKLLSSFFFAVLIGGVGGYIWSLLLQKMRQLRYAIFTTPSYVFILFGIAEFLGFSGPIAALTFGITIGNIDHIKIPSWFNKFNFIPLRHNETEKLFFGEIVFLVKTFFFVYIGLSVRFVDLPFLGIALSLTGVMLAARWIAVRTITDPSTTPHREILAMSVIVPKGTAAAVLANIPLQMQLEGGELVQNITYGVVIFSIILTSVLIFLLEKKTLKDKQQMSFRPESPEVQLLGEDTSDDEKEQNARENSPG